MPTNPYATGSGAPLLPPDQQQPPPLDEGYLLSEPAPEQYAAPVAPEAPPAGPPSEGYLLSEPAPQAPMPAAQPLPTEPPQQAGLPPVQYAEQPPTQPPPQGQGPLDQIPIVGGWLQDRVDDATQPGGLLTGKPREFRPAAEGSVPQGVGWGEDRYAAVGQKAAQGNVVGAAGDVFQANYGDVTPFRATNIDVQAEAGLREIDPQLAADLLGPAQQPDVQVQTLENVYGSDVPVLNQFREHIRANPEVYRQIATEGYTTPEGLVYQGPRAFWEYYQSGQSGLQRGLTDIAYDPVGTPIDIGSTVLSAGALPTGKFIAKNAVARGGLRVADAIGTAGLSEAVPGVLKGVGALGRKVGLLSPSEQAIAQQGGEAVAELGGAVLGEARRAGMVPEQAMLTDTGGITTINTPSGVNLTYDVDPRTRTLRIYDDPTDTSVYRTATEADFQQVTGALREMNQQERMQVREPWFDFGMRTQDATGNDLIDPLAPELPGGVTTGRNREAHRRWVDEMADTMTRFDDPAGNRPVLGHLLQDWERTFYGRDLHPLTKRTQAEHRLQSIKNVLAAAPQHNDIYARNEVARMEAQLRAPRGSIGSGFLIKKGTPAKTVNTGILDARGNPIMRTIPAVPGAHVPYTAADADYMKGLATTYSRSFWKGQQPRKGERAAGVNPLKIESNQVSRGLIDPKKPGPTAGPQRRNAYENFLAVATERFRNPVLLRGDVGAIRDRFANAAGGAPNAELRKILDGMKEALDLNNIVPGAQGLSDADVEIALSQWLRATPRFSVNPPPGGMDLTPPPLGLYPAGSASEAFRMGLDDFTETTLSTPYEVNGVLKRPWESLLEQQTKLSAARSAAKKQLSGVTLTANDARDLSTMLAQTKKLHREYRGLTAEQLAGMEDGELDRLAAATVGEDVARALGYDPAKKGKLIAAYDSFNAMLRSLILYSPARGVVYPMMQLAGNLFTLGVANKGAIRYYNPLDWRTIKRFIDDPELNKAAPAVALREAMGLGRSGNLGRVSRDQVGPYTWFSDPEAGQLRKTLGKVLAPQPIKNWADAADTLHRHSLWRSVMEPGYHQMKKQLPDWADEVFVEARNRTGLRLPLTRDQIVDAIHTLEDASPEKAFTPIELRKALIDAAGGPTAPNQRELFNAADRVHRLYREKLTELDAAAMREVNRVAFDPLETNLDRVLSRMFLFSWWNTRAANLYAQEIASSPIMLGMFSRAVAGEQQAEREGGSSPFREFMRTPAGFVTSLNPWTLSSSFLMMDAMEGPNPKADLTGLGKFFEGGLVGNNLFLSPLVKASLGWLGALGADYYRQDLTGMRRIERMLNNVAEVVNRDVKTFVATNGGNPDTVPNIDFNFFQNYFHEYLSGRIPGTQEVGPVDPQRTEQGQLGFFVQQRLLEANPELGVPDAEGNVYAYEQAFREVMENHDSEIYQRAMDDYTASLFNGPGSDKGGPLTVLGAAAREFLIPLQFQTQPTSRMDYWGRKNRDTAREDSAALGPDGQPLLVDAQGRAAPRGMLPGAEKTAVDKAMGFLPFESEEYRRYKLLENQYYGGNNPQLREVKKQADDIRYASATEPVTVAEGITFTPEQLAVMSQKDRNAIANAWLANAGYADDVAAMYEGRDQLLAEKPELANGMGWWEYAQQYPGGPWAAFDATAAVNPNVARIAQEPDFIQLRNDNPEEAMKVVKYLGPTIAGMTESRYDLPVDPKYAGVVGGLDGTVGSWFIEQKESSGSGIQAEKIAEVEASKQEYEQTIADLNAYDPSGATANEYIANIATGVDKPIPYHAYKAGVRGFSQGGGWFGSYAGYMAQNPDATIEQWAQWDYEQYALNRTIEIANDFANGTYVAEEPTVEGEAATLAAPAPQPAAPLPDYLQPRQPQRQNLPWWAQLLAG